MGFHVQSYLQVNMERVVNVDIVGAGCVAHNKMDVSVETETTMCSHHSRRLALTIRNY